MVSMQIAALVAALSSTGETVLLDFQAPWCAPCRSMESTIAELERAGYPVRKVNIDHERQLAEQYRVHSIPCFVLLVDGQEAGRLLGAARRSELVDLFAKARVDVSGQGKEIARAQSPDPTPGTPVPAEIDRNPFTASARSGVMGGLLDRRRGRPAPSPPTAPPPASGTDLVACSVRLTVADPQGNSFGSGTLIDARRGEALVLTCGHIFRDSQGKGQITVDMFGPNAPQKLPGRLVKYDLKADIALVSIRPGVPVSVAPVAPKSHRIAKGDRVTSVGCNNGGPATAIESTITSIDKFLGPPNVQVSGLPVQGRSGGGLFSADGQVIGVCNAADPTDNEGLYAALASIQDQLDQAGLTAVYEERAGQNDASLARGQQPATRVASAQGQLPGTRQPQNLTSSDDEGAEVICVIRPLKSPQAASEVIRLDRASAALLRQLAADRKAQDARHVTSLEVPSGSSQPAPAREPIRSSLQTETDGALRR